MMVTSADLIAEIILRPNEWDRYLICSDLLKDEGNVELAVTYQWMGERHRHPLFNPGTKRPWVWVVQHSAGPHVLPPTLFGFGRKYFGTWSKAVQCLQWGLVKARATVIVSGDIQTNAKATTRRKR